MGQEDDNKVTRAEAPLEETTVEQSVVSHSRSQGSVTHRAIPSVERIDSESYAYITSNKV